MSLEELKNVDIVTVERESLVDIREVRVSRRLSSDKQVAEFISQIKNPYCYKHGEYVVKINFIDTDITLTDRLREIIMRSAEVEMDMYSALDK